MKEKCTTSNQGRLIQRSFDEDYLERVRSCDDTPAFTAAMRTRSTWIEGLFVEANRWHGLHWFRLRGLANVNIQALMVAAGQNLKGWLAAIGWGCRSFPGAAGAPCERMAPVLRTW